MEMVGHLRGMSVGRREMGGCRPAMHDGEGEMLRRRASSLVIRPAMAGCICRIRARRRAMLGEQSEMDVEPMDMDTETRKMGVERSDMSVEQGDMSVE